jgi:Flp pilus assembly pilin Flp
MQARLAFCKDENGQTAAEFALVLIVFLGLVFGTLGLSFAVWANETLQYAAEATARCLSVTPSSCANVQTYGLSQYAGPNISPVFSQPSSPGCGHPVKAIATIPLDAVVVSTSISLTALACFP